nr:ParB N-terminal domain-containing protein [uncultured Ralstonia sp.]
MYAELTYCIALKPTTFFVPSEEVDAGAVQRLATSIENAGVWNTLIPVERTTGIVMDGNHRVRAAALLGLHHLPCVLLDYADPRVSVTHWRTGAPFNVDSIRERILTQQRLFPYKTTRHRFWPVLPTTEMALMTLSTPLAIQVEQVA